MSDDIKLWLTVGAIVVAAVTSAGLVVRCDTHIRESSPCSEFASWSAASVPVRCYRELGLQVSP